MPHKSKKSTCSALSNAIRQGKLERRANDLLNGEPKKSVFTRIRERNRRRFSGPMTKTEFRKLVHNGRSIGGADLSQRDALSYVGY